jgi:azurin
MTFTSARAWAAACVAALVLAGTLGAAPRSDTASARHATHESVSVPQTGRTVTAVAGKVVVIRSTGVDLAYSVTTIRAKAGDTLTVRYDNTASEMAHNIVLLRSEDDIVPVGTAALAAYGSDYIPADEKDRILSYTTIVNPGETIEWTFVVPPPGTYPYICTFSGHFTMMQGRLISTD